MINIFVATTVIAVVSLTVSAYTLHAEKGELSKSVNVENKTWESISNGVSQISRGYYFECNMGSNLLDKPSR